MPQRGHRHLCPFRSLSRLQSPHNVHPARPVVLQIAASAGSHLFQHRHRNEDIGNLPPHSTLKRRCRHADDLERLAVDRERLSHHARVTTQMCLPVVEAQHCHGIASGRRIVCRAKQPPRHRRNTQHAEIVAAYDLCVREVRRAVSRNPNLSRSRSDQPIERCSAVAQVSVHWIREGLFNSRTIVAGRSLPCFTRSTQNYQLLRRANRQRAKQRLVQQRKNRRVGAHAKRKRQHRSHHETRRPPNLAKGVAKALYQRLHRCLSVSIVSMPSTGMHVATSSPAYC